MGAQTSCCSSKTTEKHDADGEVASQAISETVDLFTAEKILMEEAKNSNAAEDTSTIAPQSVREDTGSGNGVFDTDVQPQSVDATLLEKLRELSQSTDPMEQISEKLKELTKDSAEALDAWKTMVESDERLKGVMNLLESTKASEEAPKEAGDMPQERQEESGPTAPSGEIWSESQNANGPTQPAAAPAPAPTPTPAPAKKGKARRLICCGSQPKVLEDGEGNAQDSSMKPSEKNAKPEEQLRTPLLEGDVKGEA